MPLPDAIVAVVLSGPLVLMIRRGRTDPIPDIGRRPAARWSPVRDRRPLSSAR